MQDSVNQPGFLFHDYETFGTSPSLDRPAQFAAIRTDAELNVLGEPEVFYCKPADDYLPQPQAVMITGITPQEALAKGDNEAAFARRIHDLFTVPQTCIVGYNNVRFDDEVTRNIFYRNFYDPYAWSWQHDNSRWDLLDVMRACYALRPEGIAWPENDEGLPSFRLEHLTVANGIEHQNAHDAMADVYATIAMAKLVKTRQPRLFDYLYSHRNKRKLATLIDVPQMKPLVHVSGMFGAARGNTSLVAPLAWHPENRNAVIMVDLAGDMAPLLELDADALRERLYYNGFFSDADRAAMKIVLETEPRNLPALDITFADKRIERLLFNYRARNFPGTLDEHEQQRWLEHRRQVFTPEFLQAYADELQMLYQQYADDKEKLAQLKALWQYAQDIV